MLAKISGRASQSVREFRARIATRMSEVVAKSHVFDADFNDLVGATWIASALAAILFTATSLALRFRFIEYMLVSAPAAATNPLAGFLRAMDSWHRTASYPWTQMLLGVICPVLIASIVVTILLLPDRDWTAWNQDGTSVGGRIVGRVMWCLIGSFILLSVLDKWSRPPFPSFDALLPSEAAMMLGIMLLPASHCAGLAIRQGTA